MFLTFFVNGDGIKYKMGFKSIAPFLDIRVDYFFSDSTPWGCGSMPYRNE
jgi:hypothetical protein